MKYYKFVDKCYIKECVCVQHYTDLHIQLKKKKTYEYVIEIK